MPESARLLPGPFGVLAAYRADAATRGFEPFGSNDGVWLGFGTLLEHAGRLPADAAAATLAQAVVLLRWLLDDATWGHGPSLDPIPPTDEVPLRGRVRSVAEEIENAGALRLADAVLRAYTLADAEMPPLEIARVEAMRARLAWKEGDVEVATTRYRKVERAATELKSDELRLRAIIGFAVLARLRGNYPEVRQLAQHALDLAERVGMPRFASMAHHALLVATAVAGDFAAAVRHGWLSYVMGTGDAIMEAEALGNLGQLFLDHGHPLAASSAFQVVVARRPPTRVAIPALGGLVVAATILERWDLVERTSTQLEGLLSRVVQPYDATTALLDLARAYSAAGDVQRAADAQHRALDLARTHGYHELMHHAEQPLAEFTSTRSTSSPVSDEVERVAEAVHQLVAR